MKKLWEDVRETLDSGAVSIIWDGCHKIYIVMDEEQHNLMVDDYGYEIHHRLDEINEDIAYEFLKHWFYESCGLRFISEVHMDFDDSNKGYRNIISQFAISYEEDDDID